MMSFDLEKAISAWRKSLSNGRAFLSGDLEELERHLRDHLAGVVGEGYSEEDAFRKARASLGTYSSLEKAYKTVFWRKLRHQRLLVANLFYHISMVRSYTTSAVRNLIRHKGYSALNISGLAIGLTASFLILLWVQNELSVDGFHARGAELFQVKINNEQPTGISTWSNVPFPMAETLESTIPEIERAVLTLPMRAAVRREGQASREGGYFASDGFFEAFSFPLIVGDSASALLDPSSIVISESVAIKYFGADWRSGAPVLGKLFRMDYWQSDGGVLGQGVTEHNGRDFTITGVFETPPRQSTLRFDLVVPVEDLVSSFGHLERWGPRWFELTVEVAKGSSPSVVSGKVESMMRDHVAGIGDSVILQPFSDTYLYGSFENGHPAGGRIRRVQLLGLIGLAILLMACINFTNLVTARSNQRAREVGVRKAVGATPAGLMQQFLGEALLTSLVAFVAAAGLTVLWLPLFNSVAGTAITEASLTPDMWGAFLGITLLAGFAAGAYPAFYLASLNVIRILRSQVAARRRGEVSLRRGLIVVQFGIAALLMVGTLTIYQQLDFLRTKDLGLDKDNVVMLRLEGSMNTQFEAAVQQLAESPHIESVSRTSAHPVGVAIKNANLVWEGKQEQDNVLFAVLRTDEQFAETMKLGVTSGRFFDANRDAGQLRYVVNESAVAAMGLADPVGHPFSFGFDVEGPGTGDGVIIGVVKDFHTGSLAHEAISPLVFRYEPEGANYLLARVSEEQTANALGDLERVNASLNPGYAFDYTFLDESYQAYYQDEDVLGTLSRLFAFIAILISCLGLLGLSAFSIQQRAKEIGVRRVLGASGWQVIYSLSREFVQLVLLALLLALPMGYWLMLGWLDTFAYRIDMSPGILIITAVFSVSIAMLTVGFQALRATRWDPVRSLRSE